MDNINFKKVLDDGELFDQQANYEENFEKINQLVVPKITDLETNKVDKVAGKGLSTNDYTTTEKNKLAGIPVDTAAQLSGKVDKVTGKGLSTNDFSNEYKAKIDVDIPAQLADIEQKVDVDIPAQLNEKALKTEVGLLSGLLTTAKTSLVNAINELFNSKVNKTQEDWITPTLLNGFTQLSTFYIRYRKDGFGRVHFRGAVTGNSTPGAIICNLPVGYRPIGAEIAIVSYGTGSLISVAITVLPNGDVKLAKPNGSTGYFLDAISFATI